MNGPRLNNWRRCFILYSGGNGRRFDDLATCYLPSEVTRTFSEDILIINSQRRERCSMDLSLSAVASLACHDKTGTGGAADIKQSKSIGSCFLVV